MKNFNYLIANRTRNFPACSAVPQTTAPPFTPENINADTNILGISKILGLCAVGSNTISALNTGMAISKIVGSSMLLAVLNFYFELAGTVHQIQNSLPNT
jgi:hypothetical protein